MIFSKYNYILKYLMIKIFKLFFVFAILLTFSNTFANQVNVYWEENPSTNPYWEEEWWLNLYTDIYKEKLNETLDVFYKKTWLNTDIIILWKWDSCYLDINFDSCIQERENYTSDLIVILSMKSDIKKIWDIRTLVKGQYNKIITPELLSVKHDDALIRFEKNNFVDWLIWYLEWIETYIEKKCDEYNIAWACNAPELEKNYYAYVNKVEQKALMKKVFLGIIIISLIMIFVLYLLYYRRKIILLKEEIKFYILSLWECNTEELVNINEKLKRLKLSIENNLEELNKNIVNWRIFYMEMRKIFDTVKLEADIIQEKNDEIEGENI